MRRRVVTVATVLAMAVAGVAVAAGIRSAHHRMGGEMRLAQMMGRGGMHRGGMMGRGMMGPGYGNEAAPSGSGATGTSDGARLYRSQCAGCHTLRAGAGNGVGPSLNGVIGRRAGSLPGYDYSAALRQAGRSGLVWNAQTLAAFLADPQKDIPGNKMPFAGIANRTSQQAVVGYLERVGR